jgi:hypothetical protein
VLDIAFFSSIIYIWYEGYLLSPPVVRLCEGLNRSHPPLGGRMAKKAKAAKKAAKKTAKKK